MQIIQKKEKRSKESGAREIKMRKMVKTDKMIKKDKCEKAQMSINTQTVMSQEKGLCFWCGEGRSSVVEGKSNRICS